MKLETLQTKLLAGLGAGLAVMILASPAAARETPDGYQPQLGSGSSVLHDGPDGYQPQLAGPDSIAANTPASVRDRPDGYQPQLGVTDLAGVADDDFDWTTSGFAASIIAAMLLASAATFTYGNRRRYRSA